MEPYPESSAEMDEFKDEVVEVVEVLSTDDTENGFGDRTGSMTLAGGTLRSTGGIARPSK